MVNVCFELSRHLNAILRNMVLHIVHVKLNDYQITFAHVKKIANRVHVSVDYISSKIIFFSLRDKMSRQQSTPDKLSGPEDVTTLLY